MSKKHHGSKGNPAKRQIQQKPVKATVKDWMGGARIRTLPLAFGPVLVGTGAAIVTSGPELINWLIAGLALCVSLFLQVGVNFSNDYSDGIRGTDSARVGPARLVGGGKTQPKKVLIVALCFYTAAALAGSAVTILTGRYWFLIVGAVAIAAAWFYTGGRRPYGYFALGELFVFIFFGLVATLGTTFALVGSLNQESWFGAVAVGLVACAAMTVNNLRDIDQDRAGGKRTLSVAFGRVISRVLYGTFVIVPYGLLAVVSLFYPAGWFGMFGLLIAVPAVVITSTARTSEELILVLKLTGLIHLVLSLGFFCAYIVR